MVVGLVLGVVFALGWVLLFVFRAEAVTEALPRYTPRERFWVTLTPIVMAVHMTCICTAISCLPTVSLSAAAIGLSLFGVAVAFWFWGRAMIGPLRVRRLPDEPPLQLQRHGAFGVVRHPLYASYLLAAAAPLVIAPRGLFLVTYALCWVAVSVRAVQEEHRLRAQLGAAYDAYCRDVKRLIPFVW